MKGQQKRKREKRDHQGEALGERMREPAGRGLPFFVCDSFGIRITPQGAGMRLGFTITPER